MFLTCSLFFLIIQAIKQFEVTLSNTSPCNKQSRTHVFIPNNFLDESYPIVSFTERSYRIDEPFFTTIANAGFIVIATFSACDDLTPSHREWLRSSQFNAQIDRLGIITSSIDEAETGNDAAVILGPLRASDLNSRTPMFFVGNETLIIQPVLYKRTNSKTILPKKRKWHRPSDYSAHVASFFRCHLHSDPSACGKFQLPSCRRNQICLASEIISTARRRRRILQKVKEVHARAGPVHPDHIATHSPEENYDSQEISDYTDIYTNYVCTNDLSSRDTQGRNCDDWYDDHPKDCGKYDVINKGFTAHTQCCSCYDKKMSIRGEPWEYPDNTMSPSVDSQEHSWWPWDLPPIVYTWQFGIAAGFFVGILLACILIRLCDSDPKPHYDIMLEEKRRARLRRERKSPGAASPSAYRKLAGTPQVVKDARKRSSKI